MAAIAAGSELANENFLGAAPEADIAFVKLKEAKPFIRQLERIPQDSIAYEEADIMLGIRYLDLLAQQEGKPLIICLALGSNSRRTYRRDTPWTVSYLYFQKIRPGSGGSRRK